ncbi:MAG: carbamoyl-phosphate synthase large subunit [Pseudomonadota bacterium]
MPRRTDIESILIIGAGPIVIGQACEFDYSGTQACVALKSEGYRVILVNSNPATIMTDPGVADATYIEPITWEVVAEIIEREKPDALLPTMGGQTALNCALDLDRHGVLEKFGVELIGASQAAIDKAEDRQKFREAMDAIGLKSPKSILVNNFAAALEAQTQLGFPTIIRPSFTLGGTGGGIAFNKQEFEEICKRGLDASPTSEILVEQSVLGWKEYEMEVVRDRKDNCIIICAIENLDPMGVHTGDSITVAPAQTLTDKEYQILRNASIAVLREIGVDTGGSNVQFAINPDNGELVVIEMNPRVSRSSALASKATGFPIAKVAARLAVGYTLDELDNDITGGATPASFEPSIDYVVTKVPRFTFEKFPQADDRLTTQMKSVGEVMAIGRTFQESMLKALRGTETGICGFDEILEDRNDRDTLNRELSSAGAHRIRYVADAFRLGYSRDEVFERTHIDPWFLVAIEDIVSEEQRVREQGFESLDAERLRSLKRKGFSDARLASLCAVSEEQLREHRWALGITPVYKRVDSCAAEFDVTTAYMYSTYESECESLPTDAAKVIVLGGGPNRIGQGIEFDYCCVQASMAARDAGFESIMINCNPETVSTDYDISDRLYFEPLSLEDVLEVVRIEQPKGVILQFGGQTPLKLARALEKAGVNILGTSPDSIDLAEDRERFKQFLIDNELKQPANETVRSSEAAKENAEKIGYPLVVRPSYVLGGRAMEIVYNSRQLARYMDEAVAVSEESPVLLDKFLNHAIEVDVDAVSDGEQVLIGGIMEHIEEAGVHSGDSACALPPHNLSAAIQDEIRRQITLMAKGLGVVGLVNAQFAIQGNEIFVLEVNPRASRTAPFVSKAVALSLPFVAAQCMLGRTLAEQGVRHIATPQYCSVKEAVFPFAKFPGVDPLLGPEMKSTGEVMGIGATFGEAFGKSQRAANMTLPTGGCAFISVRDEDKPEAVKVGRRLSELGFDLTATGGTARALAAEGVECRTVKKVLEGRPHIVDMIKNEEIDLIINTTEGETAIADSYTLRTSAIQRRVAYTTTMAAANAVVSALGEKGGKVRKLQQLHEEILAQ